ncbi:signal recognition particle-docking protein FtsY [bacterium]|nr:signal recognition particle-docking protein FtsY [bacterium]
MNLFERFRNGLSRTRENTVGKIAGIFNRKKLTEEALEELEDILLEADIGVDTVEDLLNNLRMSLKNGTGANDKQPMEILEHDLIELLENGKGDREKRFSHKPWIILMVGVNGSGKTTSAGKLSYYFKLQNKKSVIAAADTFRAAAVEQVEEWAARGDARLIKQNTGADPAAVTYDAYLSTKARGEDVLIVDTAGRLQAKRNLMQELTKITRVLKRHDETAPHEVLIVIDATTGQNGLSQARGFMEASGCTGLLVTKLDGTARGGIIVPIHRELGLPVEFVGLGEGLQDLQPFEGKAYVKALLNK